MGLSPNPDARAAQLANLKPAKPGESPNRLGINGRPIRAALLLAATGDRCEKLSAVVWREALKGRPWAVEFLTERLEGKAEQPVSNADGTPFTILFQSVDDRA